MLHHEGLGRDVFLRQILMRSSGNPSDSLGAVPSAFRGRKVLRPTCRYFRWQECSLRLSPSVEGWGNCFSVSASPLHIRPAGRLLAKSLRLDALFPSSFHAETSHCPPSPQVDLLARQLEEEGERVLVVLPERYLRPCVPNSARSRRGKVPRQLDSPPRTQSASTPEPAVKKSCPVCSYGGVSSI